MDLSQRLDEMELAIHKPSFRKGTGRANEVNYWVFDYPPEKELEVRERVEYLKNKNDRGDDDFELVVFDLYDIIIDFLEKKNFMEEKLYNNYNIICDRYIFSGIAYSLANGLDYYFSSNTEQYLIKPDLTFYFDISISETNKRRKSLKTDIYETSNFQSKVKEAYSKIKNKDWIIINAEQTPEEITNIILKHILNIKNIKQFLEYY